MQSPVLLTASMSSRASVAMKTVSLWSSMRARTRAREAIRQWRALVD
jgi:hypothetical protein